MKPRSEREQDLHKPAFPLFSFLISGISSIRLFIAVDPLLSIRDRQLKWLLRFDLTNR
jgi:hypothetical protein